MTSEAGLGIRAAVSGDRIARVFEVRGVVQGVGFRPFVWRLATELGLDGSVVNRAGQVEIRVAGLAESVEAFVGRIRTDAPARARVEDIVVRDGDLEIAPGSGFTIDESEAGSLGAKTERLFPPDIATCDDCLRELDNPRDRRYQYPFINCTNCGPRATIIDDLPYDRTRTSMRAFPLCAACRTEYLDPANRRFHAEPVACPECGPQLSYRRQSDAASAESLGDAAPAAHRGVALALALDDLRAGRIVAVKGLGGYHLACDATNPAAVARLRDRKQRWAKPFAVMVLDLAAARRVAKLSREEAALLTSPARPIVLVERRVGGPGAMAAVAAGAADAAAPRSVELPLATATATATLLADAVLTADPARAAALNRRIGILLPYTPLHHLLLRGLGRPLVMTSGNLADEPLATDDDEALERLGGIADSFLAHNREIRARYDDSVTRVVAGRESVIRRGRGYAPEPLNLPIAAPASMTILAVGAELKHTFTLARDGRAHVGPHTGDLEDLMTHRAFEGNLAHLERLLDMEPEYVAHDLHPGYLSTQFAMSHFPESRRIGVQHHHAHVASAAAEAGLTGQFIGVAYDGLGMGDDGTFWGGEVLVATLANYRRVARFGLAPMPGGAMAVKKPYRMALGYLLGAEDGFQAATSAAHDGATAFLGRLDAREVEIVRVQIQRGLNSPQASSAGRLYDAVASILGIRDIAEYEAQAAIELELLAEPGRHSALAATIARKDGQSDGTSLLVYDPRATLEDLLSRLVAGDSAAHLAARFQETVAKVTQAFVAEVGLQTGINTVVLSGGVFQNQWLVANVVKRLNRIGFEVHTNHMVPANDGGISYGQAAVAAARLAGAS
jgi:hydrogenase maturation protein HypF